MQQPRRGKREDWDFIRPSSHAKPHKSSYELMFSIDKPAVPKITQSLVQQLRLASRFFLVFTGRTSFGQMPNKKRLIVIRRRLLFDEHIVSVSVKEKKAFQSKTDPKEADSGFGDEEGGVEECRSTNWKLIEITCLVPLIHRQREPSKKGSWIVETIN